VINGFAINHLSLAVLDLAKIVKGAVQKQGMLGWQYNTIGVSDGITMGGEGRSPSPLPAARTQARS
jgi:dihydroxyacid dehydratase/phosphogluconate dehydratase